MVGEDLGAQEVRGDECRGDTARVTGAEAAEEVLREGEWCSSEGVVEREGCMEAEESFGDDAGGDITSSHTSPEGQK